MPQSTVLLTAASSANRFVDDFIYVYILLIFVYILFSWVRMPYNPAIRRIQDFLREVCEPYLRLFRRVIPPFGPLDLSPMIAILSLFLVKGVVDAIFARFS